MFSLLISFISIVLAASLAGATLLYAGDNFLKGSSQVDATILINTSQQLGAADMLYKNLAGQWISTGGSSENKISNVASGCTTPGYSGCFPNDYLKAVPVPPIRTTGLGGAYYVNSKDDIEVPLKGELGAETCQSINRRVDFVDANNEGRLDLSLSDVVDAKFGCYASAGTYYFYYNAN